MRKILAIAFALVCVTTAGPARAACTGDCGGNGEVTVDEITIMVNVALGSATTASCTAGDANGDGEVTVEEIVAAVGFALNSCPVVGGALGTRRFTMNPRTSPFTAVLSPGFSLNLGAGFKGQTNGVVENGFFEFKAGEPDANGYASLDITAGSEYLFVDARPTANLVLCLKPLLPITNAGIVLCNGGPDVSIAINANHHLGQVGLNAYTAKDCLSDCSSSSGGCGSIESPNQICAAGIVGDERRADADCNSAAGTSDGICGLGRLCTSGKRGDACTSNNDCDMGESNGVCSLQPKCTAGKSGTNCRADAECDTAADAFDGVCGNVDPHPGVCNSPISFGQTGAASEAGAVSIAPLAELGLKGLPAVLSIESATPCGDEGGGMSTPFALTSALVRATIDNFSNGFGVCTKGDEGAECTTDAECNLPATTSNGVCGDRLIYESRGQNFSCQNWTQADGPGCLSLAVPAIDSNPMGGDLVTAFKFCGK